MFFFHPSESDPIWRIRWRRSKDQKPINEFSRVEKERKKEEKYMSVNKKEKKKT